ncbi:hypothetical protein [Tolypothrix sp. VBCCA 56010]|uniref:hypothetical protein n=1 Tax=Tolypothrix sp. VBCCA 56010 TaxID=3137731 RepID=UPI003D7DE96B
MPTVTNVLTTSTTIGGEDLRISLNRTLAAITQKVSDSVITLPEGQASTSPTTLWAAATHGVATNPQPETFKLAVLIVDPDGELPTSLPIDVEIASTRHNSTTVDKVVREVRRETPLLIGSSVSGQSISEVGDGTDLFALLNGTTPTNPPRVTRIRARNPNPAASGANNVKVRLVVLA